MENDEYVFLKFIMMMTHVCIPIPIKFLEIENK